MFLYISIFIICIIGLILNDYLKDQRHKKIFEIAILIILCIISGTRYYLGGSDYYVYKGMFDAVPTLKYFDFNTIHDIDKVYGAEKGFLFICSIIKTLGFNFFGFTLIHCIFFYTCLYIGLKKYTNNFNLLIIIFLYKMFFYNTFISMRQSITVAIFFVAIKFIQERKIIKYFICCIIATTIHNGALLLFPIYFINKIKLSKKLIIILNCIFIPTIIISLCNLPILKPLDFLINIFDNEVAVSKAEDLVNGNSTNGINVLHTMEYFVIMYLLIKNYENITKIDKNSDIIIKLFLILLPLFTLFRGYSILTRQKDYFTLTYAIILGYCCMIKDKRFASVVQISTIAICLFGFVRFITLFDNGGMIPYETYLTKNISIFDKI